MTALEKALQDIDAFLPCATPDAWLNCARSNLPLLLVDHANCEKKAASTALNLIYRYIDSFPLLHKMSRLAREELRHFEQVIAIMEKRGMVYEPVSASRYAAELRRQVRTHEPERLVDTLIIGAIIEARSCERFARLAPLLDEELQNFYLSLLKSEARHYRDYLSLAESVMDVEMVAERCAQLLAIEKGLIEEADDDFRFHSGPPSA